jgi:zinc protease
MLAARRVTLADPRAKQPSLTRTYIAPSYANAEGHTAHALDLLSVILGGGSTSRLHRALVADQGLAASAGSYYQGDALDQGRFVAYAIPRENVDMDRLEKAMDAELARIVKDGVTAEELTRAKKRLVAETIYAQDSQTALARAYGTTLTTGGTVDDVKNWPADIEKVSAAEVQAAAKLALQINRSVTGLLLTEETPAQ